MPLPLKPGYNFNVDRAKKKCDYKMPTMELYTHYYGISYTVSGHRKFITPNMVGILQSGCIGMTAKNVYHRTSYITTEPYERFVVKFTDVVVKRLIDIIGQDTFHQLYNCPVYHFTEPIQEKLYGIFCDMHDEFEHYSKCSELILEGMLHHLLVIVMNERLPLNDEDIMLNREESTIIDAIHFIEANYLDNPSLETVATKVSLSPSYFSKFFKKIMGSTYSEYLNNIRIQHARELLVKTDYSVGKIAELSGFSNGNYFCSVLKKTDGLSPKEFRTQYNSSVI